MKRFFRILSVVLLAFAAALAAVGCADGENTPAAPEQLPEADGKVLIAYFSYTGNTERVAHSLQEMTGGDLFEIQREPPYDMDVDDPEAEIENNARPPLAAYLPAEEMAEYATVFVGYPIWYQTMPAPVRTFLEYYDFTGKSVISFCTAASSTIAGSNDDFAESARHSAAGEVNVIFGRRFRTNETDAMRTWLDTLGL